MASIRSVRRNDRGSFMPVNPGYEEALAVDMEFSAEILFAPRGPLAGKPYHASLRMLSGAVADVIAPFEEAFGTTALRDHCHGSRNLTGRPENS
jgi:hypothetical protein